MGKRKERRLAAIAAAGRRVKLDLFAEPSGEMEGASKDVEVGDQNQDHHLLLLLKQPTQCPSPLPRCGSYSPGLGGRVWRRTAEMARRAWLVAADLAMSFMWVWAGALAKLAVYGYLRGWAYHHPAAAEALKVSLAVLYMFFFAWAGKLTGGGSYNPLSVLASAFAGGPNGLLFTAFARIPAQVIGSIIGVRLIKDTFPSIGHGPRLNVDIHRGALTEGLLTLMIIIVALGLKKKDPKSFFMKTWISSVSKVTLHILGSDLTGGIMNPASAFGWAYARGDHITLEHLFVYWLAPIQATVVGVWAFRLLTEPKSKRQHSEKDKKDKSD